jgi:BirA family biotin operon repressor/biotin-[acetyl-CoA-carboxylase] ligase
MQQMLQLEVLKLLADGEIHPEKELVKSFNLSGSILSKYIYKLRKLEIEVEFINGQGYRLSRPIDFLSPQKIFNELKTSMAGRIHRLDVFPELDSTNTYLLSAPIPDLGQMTVCLAEHQTSGRGRRGKQWSTPFGGGLCLSVGWLFDEIPQNLSALSLSVAVVVRRVIGELIGFYPLVKWPNDLVWKDQKLGGVLIESSSGHDSALHVVVGIGINVSIDPTWLKKICDWPKGAIDVNSIGKGKIMKNKLASRLVEDLYETLESYGTCGFELHHEEFIAANYLKDREVVLSNGSSSLSGTVIAVDLDGALILETASGAHRVISGEVSLRPS